MDALSDVLKAVRLEWRGVISTFIASEPWVAETPAGRSVVPRCFQAPST